MDGVSHLDHQRSQVLQSCDQLFEIFGDIICVFSCLVCIVLKRRNIWGTKIVFSFSTVDTLRAFSAGYLCVVLDVLELCRVDNDS